VLRSRKFRDTRPSQSLLIVTSARPTVLWMTIVS
jgi:hypothetical protein